MRATGNHRIPKSQPLLIIIILAALLVTGGCTLPFLAMLDGADISVGSPDDRGSSGDIDGDDDGGSGPIITAQMITIRAESFSLAWDPPLDAVDSYRLYYRNVETDDWHDLGSTGAEELQFEISDAVLGDGYGRYAFAVQSVTPDGSESELHSSLSPTAQPETGWYVDWQQPL